MKLKNIIKSVCFISGLIMIYCVLQAAFIPKWNYPQFYENATIHQNNANRLKNGSIDVAFLGTSNVEFSISPMELYKNYGIVSYNYATSTQPIVGSYYVLHKIFEKQHPKIVVLDPSSLFFNSDTPYIDMGYRYIIDSIHSNVTKLDLVDRYISDTYTQGTGFQRLIESFLPLLKYHSRWDQLTEYDIKNQNYNDFLLGYFFSTISVSAETDIDGMNSNASIMLSDNVKNEYSYNNGVYSHNYEQNILYDPDISDQNKMYLKLIKEECDRNKCKLILVKIPSIRFPHTYFNAWTKIKSDMVVESAAEYQIDFIDLLYNSDLSINWTIDTTDQGIHMNYFGAMKVSDYVGNLLISEYSIAPKEYEYYDSLMPMYEDACQIAKLEMSYEFVEYLSLLKEIKDESLIIISVKDDMVCRIEEPEIGGMKSLGLETDFKNMQPFSSYIAIIDSGKVCFESSSNRLVIYENRINDSQLYVTSAGLRCGNVSSIQIDQIEYSTNDRGINIVVYNKETESVVDSVRFDSSLRWNAYHNDAWNQMAEYIYQCMLK